MAFSKEAIAKALRRVATTAAGDFDPEELFDTVCEELAGVLGVESTDILRFDGDGWGTVVGSWAGPQGPNFPVGTRVPIDGETVSGKLIHTGKPQRVDDYTRTEGRLADMLRSFHTACAAGAPIMLAGRLWGGIMASSHRPYALPEGTEQQIAEFAELVTAALANADARQQLAESRARIVEAGYAERRRLGRDLHDGAQQELVGAAMTLRLAQRSWSQEEEARELVDAALEQIMAGLRDLRELAAGIHPSVLTDRGLRAGLDSLATRSPIRVDLGPVPEQRLPPSVETTAYFVVAEALTNAAKHARCRSARVSVSADDHSLLVEVLDDGLGGADVSTGSGLRGLEDRVSALGGSLEVDSPLGEGTAIRARLSLDPESRPPAVNGSASTRQDAS